MYQEICTRRILYQELQGKCPYKKRLNFCDDVFCHGDDVDFFFSTNASKPWRAYARRGTAAGAQCERGRRTREGADGARQAAPNVCRHAHRPSVAHAKNRAALSRQRPRSSHDLSFDLTHQSQDQSQGDDVYYVYYVYSFYCQDAGETRLCQDAGETRLGALVRIHHILAPGPSHRVSRIKSFKAHP